MSLADKIVAAFQAVAADVQALYAKVPRTIEVTLDFGNPQGGGELVTSNVPAAWCTPPPPP